MRYIFWALLLFLMGVHSGIVLSDFVEFISYDDEDDDDDFL